MQAGLHEKLKELTQELPWEERLDVAVEPDVRMETEEEISDDFQRELIL